MNAYEIKNKLVSKQTVLVECYPEVIQVERMGESSTYAQVLGGRAVQTFDADELVMLSSEVR